MTNPYDVVLTLLHNVWMPWSPQQLQLHMVFQLSFTQFWSMLARTLFRTLTQIQITHHLPVWTLPVWVCFLNQAETLHSHPIKPRGQKNKTHFFSSRSRLFFLNPQHATVTAGSNRIYWITFSTWILLTDGGFTELLSCYFVGDVCSHQDTDINLHLLTNDIRDQPQALWTLIYTLRQ